MASPFSPQEIAYETAHYGENRTPGVVAGSIILIAAATIAVILRLISRKIKMREVRSMAYGLDDYLIILALLFAYGMFVALIFSARYGLGKHIIRIGLENASKTIKSVYVLEAIYPACTTTCKISILLLYRRIFTTHNATFKYAMYIISFVLVGWAISGFFTTVFQCAPVHDYWDQTGGRCIDWIPALIALASINTVVNGSILILPMPIVWKLNMPRHRKVAICGIFIIGSGDVLSSIVRTYATSQIKETDVDLTYLAADAALLALIEPCLGIVCACLPVMRPLFGRVSCGFFASVFGSVFSSKNSHKNSQNSNSTKASSTDPHSDVYPLRQKPDTEWMELAPQDSRRFVNEIHGGTSGMGTETGRKVSEVPSTGIRVRSDLESFAERGA